ncbi:zona pellucida sperm-binding protein 3-like [Gastrophryne carolinensis]
MVVTVDRDLFGNGKLVKISDLLLGPGPDPCKPDPSQTDMAVFQSPLQDCGNTAEMFQDWVIYSTILTYNPTAPAGIPISRTNAAIVPIQCFYPRHGNVSSKAIKPTWAPFSTTVSSSEKLAFNLQLMTSDWRDISPPFFKLGDIMYLQASVDIQNHAPMILFVDSCVATTTPDENSDPRYEIIADNGCLMDGMQDDASSAFISPRVQPNELQFTVDAFIFLNLDISEIFITCNLRAVPVTQVPDDLNKACSFSKSSNSWSAVEGPSNICQCCATKTCVTPASRSDEQQMVSTLGPLTVVRPHSSLGLKKAEQTDVVEFWALAAVGGVSLVFVAVCAALIGKTLAKPKQLVFTVEK